MKSKDSSKNLLEKDLVIVFITIVLTAIIYSIAQPWISRKVRWAMMTQQERIEDTMAVKPTTTPVEDSITVANGKLSRGDFEEQYSASEWVKEFEANRVRFNNKYNNQAIDVFGQIKDISTSVLGYSIIKLDTGNSDLDIICNNVKHDKDAWLKEVENQSVGDTVHIRGIYKAMQFDQESFYIFHCHILPDK